MERSKHQGCHLGYEYTDPQLTVKAYPHTMVWVPIGCSWMFLGSCKKNPIIMGK